LEFSLHFSFIQIELSAEKHQKVDMLVFYQILHIVNFTTQCKKS